VIMLTVPLENRVADQTKARERNPLESYADAFRGAPIMVIDNERAVLDSMQALLERWGCSVMAARSEAEALELLATAEQQPSVILADYHLDNNLTGCEAIYGIRRKLDRDVPAAIITADSSDHIRKLVRAQYLPILNKPVKPNRLRALLTSLLGPSAE